MLCSKTMDEHSLCSFIYVFNLINFGNCYFDATLHRKGLTLSWWKTMWDELKGLIAKNDFKKHSIMNKLLMGFNEINYKITTVTKARLMIKYLWCLWFVGGDYIDYQRWFWISIFMLSDCLNLIQITKCLLSLASVAWRAQY